MQEQFDRRYLRRSDKQMTAVQNSVNALLSESAGQTHRVGRLTLPAILLAGTNTQTLTWTKPMPSASYEVAIQQDAAIIGSVTTQILSQTAAAVQIRTTATLAISAGAQLLVIAWN